MSAGRCQELLDALNEYACAQEFTGQLQVARELYSIATGKVNDDDPFYDSRMASFQEYFLFDYRLSEVFSGSTVFETFLMNAQTRLAPAELCQYEQLRNFRHSLFLVERLRPDKLQVRDLIAGQHDIVFPLPEYSFAGFEVGQIFEGRMVTFEGINYFTGAFIFHPKDVSSLIQKHVKEFLLTEVHCKAANDIDWRAELQRRHELLSNMAEQMRQAEKAEKKRAIDVLRVSHQLVSVSRVVSSPNLVMAIGREEFVSPFVPETQFYDLQTFLQKLAYCEIRSYRYKHIDPVKVYALDGEEIKSQPPVSAIPRAAASAEPRQKVLGQEGA